MYYVCHYIVPHCRDKNLLVWPERENRMHNYAHFDVQIHVYGGQTTQYSFILHVWCVRWIHINMCVYVFVEKMHFSPDFSIIFDFFVCFLFSPHPSSFAPLPLCVSLSHLISSHRRHSILIPAPTQTQNKNEAIPITTTITADELFGIGGKRVNSLSFYCRIHFYAYKYSKWHHIKCVTLFLCFWSQFQSYNSPFFPVFFLPRCNAFCVCVHFDWSVRLHSAVSTQMP